jgi:hypothetical protein
MKDSAVFRACYADFKLIRTRSVVQIVLEVPIEGANHVLSVLGGMPTPANEAWVAVARLRGADTAASRKEETDTLESNPATEGPAPSLQTPVAGPDKRLARLAGMLCNDPKFWKFCREDGCIVHNKEQAAEHVRAVCEVQSRSEIRPGTVAEQRFNLILSAFQAWDIGPRVGAC